MIEKVKLKNNERRDGNPSFWIISFDAQENR